MKVVLLGTAAGGGFPQWNCACALCAAARDGKLPARTQESVALSGNSRDWWLLNASPDIRTQLTTTPALAPGPGPRDTPVRGVLLTDAEADHVTGPTVLRGGAGLKVYAAPPVLATLAPAVRSRGGRQAAMGHLPVAGARGSLAALTHHPGPRRIYTHLNNTNPLLDPDSDARARVSAAGVEVLPDGAEFVV